MSTTTCTCTVLGRIGNVGAIAYTADGRARLGLTVCVDRRIRDESADGGWRSEPTWRHCTIWGPLAERVHPRLAKGDLVHLVGAERLETYRKRDGGDGYSLELDVTVCVPLGRPSSGGQTAPPQPPAGQSDDSAPF